MPNPLIPDIVEAGTEGQCLILPQVEFLRQGREGNCHCPRHTSPDEVFEAIALFVASCASEPGLHGLRVWQIEPHLVEMGVDEGVHEFMEDGAGEHEDDAGMSGVDINVFAFVGGDAGRVLQVAEPVVLVWLACFFDGVDQAEEFDVAVVDLDGALSCVPTIVICQSFVLWDFVGEGGRGSYALAAGMGVPF